MGRNLKITVAAILAIACASCSSGGEEKASVPTSTTNPAETKPPAVIQSFKNPVVPAKQDTVAAASTPNLIQPTDPTERVGGVAKGRTDPFGQLLSPTYATISNTSTVVRPIPVLPPLPAVRPIPVLPPLPATKVVATNPGRKLPTRSAVISARTTRVLTPQRNKIKLGAIASAKIPVRLRPTPGFTPVLPKVLPQVIPNPTLVSVLPPPVQPELAKAVLVTGVVVLGKEPQAIIKVPNEPTSRYVQAGQRLANGVLVKRIEMNQGSNPVVIFEQYGIEVARTVGEGGINATSPPANPVSLTTPPQNAVNTGA